MFEILGVGLGTVNEMLGGQYQIPMLLLLLVLKTSMTAICASGLVYSE